ncbi:MAG: serine/threonine protein kinase, partial [Planctomycetaceae bacterium]
HERLELFRKVCEAVAHGHQKGVIHRDLKPGNVLVDSTGQPKVIDFGVTRNTDADLALTTMHTDVGALIGTLQYMSPEQFDADPGFQRTDARLGAALRRGLMGRGTGPVSSEATSRWK